MIICAVKFYSFRLMSTWKDETELILEMEETIVRITFGEVRCQSRASERVENMVGQ